MDEITEQRQHIDRQWTERGGEVAAERRPEVREAHDRLASEVETTYALVASLEERLHDLLGPERPQEAARLVDGELTLTEFGGRLLATAGALGHVNARLSSLLDRLRDGF